MSRRKLNPKGQRLAKGQLQPFEQRLERHSIPEPNSGCTLWLGAKTWRGYGSFIIRVDDVPTFRGPHVVAYELKHGPVPQGLVVDHKCRTPLCINPDHLEAVTQRENILRGEGVAAINAAKMTCLRGHPLSGADARVWVNQRTGQRSCLACKRITKRARLEQRSI